MRKTWCQARNEGYSGIEKYETLARGMLWSRLLWGREVEMGVGL